MRYKRLDRALLLGLGMVMLGFGGLCAPPSAQEEPRQVELYFEAKLLFRDRVMLQRVAIDQWAGGRLLMQARPLGPGTILELVRPLKDPWTFRWYPTKHEVKLGAAVAVAEPAGHPYGSLAGALTADAHRLYKAWWSDDVADPTAPRQPAWQTRAERFWAARHATEEKDPLHRYPVFPFHVLGGPAGRVGLVVGSDGGVIDESVTEQMSTPWLADGWNAWQRGDRRTGYGYWESDRPAWEPRTYQALAAALALLAGSPFKAAKLAETRALEAGSTYSTDGVDLPALTARFFETLNPRFEGRIDWKGDPTLRFVVVSNLPGRLTVVGERHDTPLENEGKVRYSAWRYTQYDDEVARVTHDEVQVFAAHQNGSIKAWLKIGYRPFPQAATPEDPLAP